MESVEVLIEEVNRVMDELGKGAGGWHWQLVASVAKQQEGKKTSWPSATGNELPASPQCTLLSPLRG